MPRFEDVIRPFQLPSSASANLYQPLTGQTSQQPIMVTAGVGAAVGSVRSFTSNYSLTVTSYCDLVALEMRNPDLSNPQWGNLWNTGP